ncbi:delta-6 fatty acid desaturase [Streptomyces alboflavus]|uniref:Delta-6 fatty acid desaturase n=1 Tax=Streptomyces alboflavus TaxID=67267 RepID=A0A1Z1WQH8_9ACTN|nr:delta-6 fatty acid desaturase [Streptomyces alboflavus]
MAQAAAAVAERPGGISARQRSGSDFAPLLRAVKAQGLLDRRTGWYARGIAVNAAALAAVGAGLFAIGHTWWVLLLAPVLSVLCARTAFIGHDAGHSQITDNRAVARLIGLVHGNLLLGMSVSWWNDKHNRHHANPNHTEKDPDVAADILVFTAWQARPRDSGGGSRAIRPGCSSP